MLDGDHYVVNGEKLFITNVTPGRTVGLVCLIEGRPAVLVVDLPDAENENFQLKSYGLHAIRGAYNRGIIFKDFRVPADALLDPGHGNGLTIAYHGLNLGRVALCANAAGMIRVMMANMIPWAKYRETYGQTIVTRELVQRRLGSAAGYAVANDALVAWCSTLLDAGFRGEMECIIAKIFGSEAQKHVAIEYFMKTHGGRSFLVGHLFGDHVHEFLAPCIYEGEGEMLAMGFFKSLVKAHGMEFFEPIGRALQQAGIKKPNLLNPSHLMALAGPGKAYAKWLLRQKLHSPKYTLPPMPANLRRHAEYAADFLQRASGEISGTMQKFQLALADRQCRMSELSRRVQDATTILCTALYGARSESEIVREAADIACQEITQQLTGARRSDRYYKQVTALGAAIADGQFASLAGIEQQEILMPYK
ncbi:MAG: acyl-CoA dehydrogenase family protein [Pirellulales bacterium]